MRRPAAHGSSPEERVLPGGRGTRWARRVTCVGASGEHAAAAPRGPSRLRDRARARARDDARGARPYYLSQTMSCQILCNVPSPPCSSSPSRYFLSLLPLGARWWWPCPRQFREGVGGGLGEERAEPSKSCRCCCCTTTATLSLYIYLPHSLVLTLSIYNRPGGLDVPSVVGIRCLEEEAHCTEARPRELPGPQLVLARTVCSGFHVFWLMSSRAPPV